MFLSALLVLTPLIFLHEMGHFLMAKWCKVQVQEFSVGFGPAIFSKKMGETRYKLGIIPLGGYVKMLDGRVDEVPENLRVRAFDNKHPLQKIAIVAAGPLVNFILAILLFSAVFMLPKQTLAPKVFAHQNAGMVVPIGATIHAIDGNRVQGWDDISLALAARQGERGAVNIHTDKGVYSLPIDNFLATHNSPLDEIGLLPWQPTVPATIGVLDPNGAGALMGLQIGDTVRAIDGKVIDDWGQVVQIVRQNPERTLKMQIQRGDKTMLMDIMPRADSAHGERIGKIGAGVNTNIQIPSEYQQIQKDTPLVALQKAITKTYEMSMMTLSSIKKMIIGMIGLDNLSGPVGIAQASKQSMAFGLVAVLSLMAMVSISLGVLNLLPIPILDGGHIFLHLYELIVGKSVPLGAQGALVGVGMMIMAMLFIVGLHNDISRL